MEVFQIVSVLGVHTITESVPILLQEVARSEKGSTTASRTPQ
jgi:hypothetical protein